HATSLNKFLENNNVILEYLSPYFPELNAIERVWEVIRKLEHQYFPSICDLVLGLNEQFKSFSKSNETLRKLCKIT
ncbi:MAG: hypothetical protein QW258_02015, partial [Thermoplasmata archaeon]